MKAIFHYGLRGFTFVVMTLLLAGFQTTLWYQVFGNFPSPMLWLLPCLYISLYRGQFEALITDYAIAFVVAPFTAMPMGLLLILLMILSVAGYLLKERIYWKGSRVFASYCFFAVIAFQILYFFMSWFFENRVILDWAILSRLTELALTFLVAFPLYYLFSFLDEALGSPVAPDLELQK